MVVRAGRSDVTSSDHAAWWRRRDNDRRSGARFEIVGQLIGSLSWQETLPVCNVGEGGALVESPMPLVVGEASAAGLESGAELSTVHVRVRHARRPEDGDGFLIGLQFVNPDHGVIGQLQRIISGQQGGPVALPASAT